MDLDIVRKINISQIKVKASFETLAIRHRLMLIVFLLSTLLTLLPHGTYANEIDARVIEYPGLVFDLNDLSYQDYLNDLSQNLTDQHYRELARQKALQHQKLVLKVKRYLEERGSSLAQYAPVLVSVKNWKKIVALSNAESSMCRKYPVGTANCWGVGGANLWDMGNNLGEGIIAMNSFLNNSPKGSVKYSQMSFERMNGLYKQPAADHWVYNNQVIYDELTALENSL